LGGSEAYRAREYDKGGKSLRRRRYDGRGPKVLAGEVAEIGHFSGETSSEKRNLISATELVPGESNYRCEKSSGNHTAGGNKQS